MAVLRRWVRKMFSAYKKGAVNKLVEFKISKKHGKLGDLEQ